MRATRAATSLERPSTWADATLPLYQLEVSSDNLATLYADPLSDRRVPGTFSFAGEVFPADVRFRGNVGRYSPKKSWKIVFPADSPFPNQDRINVNAFWWDPTLVRSKLAASVFEAAGIRPPANEHVLLALNGEYLGLYTRVEQMDEAFLERTGRNPGASIYKVVCGFARILPNEAAYRRCYEKETNTNTGYDDLIGFVELINNTPDDRFAAALASVMDVEAFLDYYAVIVLTADRDSAAHNIYLVHDLETDRWELCHGIRKSHSCPSLRRSTWGPKNTRGIWEPGTYSGHGCCAFRSFGLTTASAWTST